MCSMCAWLVCRPLQATSTLGRPESYLAAAQWASSCTFVCDAKALSTTSWHTVPLLVDIALVSTTEHLPMAWRAMHEALPPLRCFHVVDGREARKALQQDLLVTLKARGRKATWQQRRDLLATAGLLEQGLSHTALSKRFRAALPGDGLGK